MTKVISVGGLGGSGTRVVADIFIQYGIFFGDWRRQTNDNLAFSALFRDSALLDPKRKTDFDQRLSLFIRYMQTNKLSPTDVFRFISLSRKTRFFKTANIAYRHLLSKTCQTRLNRQVWGWKEPNIHFYLKELFSEIHGLKYVHVLRHGLDMAFSNNTSQMKNFGFLYGLEITGLEKQDELAYKQLEFWIKSTQNFLAMASENEEDTFLLNFDHLCIVPKKLISQLLTFCELPFSEDKLNSLAGLVKTPDSSGRHSRCDIRIFDQSQLDFVLKMGFDI